MIHEGVLGPHSSWKKIVHFFNQNKLLQRFANNTISFNYPAEEFILPTIIHYLSLSETMRKTCMLVDDNDEPTKINDIRLARSQLYMLIIKSVSRTPGHPILEYCRENQY